MLVNRISCYQSQNYKIHNKLKYHNNTRYYNDFKYHNNTQYYNDFKYQYSPKPLCYNLYEIFYNASNKQNYWDNLSDLDKQEHIKKQTVWEITIKGDDFNNLYKDYKIIYTDKNNKIHNKETLLKGDINFNIIKNIDSKNMDTKNLVYYATIPPDAQITISDNSLNPEYYSNKIIINKLININ